MTDGRYQAHGPQAEFEPGSGGRVLRNRLGIKRVREIEQAESEALLAVQEWAVGHFSAEHRFTANDIRLLHRPLCADGRMFQEGDSSDFAVLSGEGVTVAANGRRMPSTADELAAELWKAIFRCLSLRSQGFCCKRVFAMK